MKKITSRIAIAPASRLLFEELLAEGRVDRVARQLLDRERQRAEPQDVDELVGLRPSRIRRGRRR